MPEPPLVFAGERGLAYASYHGHGRTMMCLCAALARPGSSGRYSCRSSWCSSTPCSDGMLRRALPSGPPAASARRDRWRPQALHRDRTPARSPAPVRGSGLQEGVLPPAFIAASNALSKLCATGTVAEASPAAWAWASRSGMAATNAAAATAADRGDRWNKLRAWPFDSAPCSFRKSPQTTFQRSDVRYICAIFVWSRAAGFQ